MTTNHRPTLESKRGKVKSITDSIIHARALPQSGSLKYRTDIPSGKFKDGVRELKRELLELEGNVKKRRKEDEVIESVDINVSSKGEEVLQQSSIKPDDVDEGKDEVEEKEEEGKKEEEEADEEADEDDDSEDEETALLMAEIAKIRKDRLEKDKPATALINIDQDNEVPVKKSWRSSTFKNKTQEVQEKPKDNYDTLNSEFHQKFLSKYVR